MSIDTLAHQASQGLKDATRDLDLDDALRTTLDRSGGRRRIVPALVIATAILVLIVGWSLSGELRRSAVPAPPADAPSPVLVGQKLGAPMTAVAPDGWEVLRNGSYVEMHPADGSPGVHLFMLVPRKVYDPPSYELAPLGTTPYLDDRTHPDLTPNGQFGVDGPGFAWMGIKDRPVVETEGRRTRTPPHAAVEGTWFAPARDDRRRRHVPLDRHLLRRLRPARHRRDISHARRPARNRGHQ